MAGQVLPLSAEELSTRVEHAPRATRDDVSITSNGRRLDSKDAVMAWLAEVEADRATDRRVDFDAS